MKKILYTLFSLLLVGSLAAQDVTFSDDFEGYSDGDPIAATSDTWASWGSPGGGADDAFVSTEQAFSGTNSLKLEAGVPTGGPTDVVLPFGAKYEAGNFAYESMMYVVGETGAYFNFQGETTIGQVWVMSNYFNADGTVTFNDSNNAVALESTYPQDEWFKLRIEIDLTNNVWEVLMNDQSVGTFSNIVNAIASLNIYAFNPADGASIQYVDDVKFEYSEPVLLQLDAVASNIFGKRDVLAGKEVALSFEVRNIGMDFIESFDATMTDGTNSVTQSYEGQFIGSLEAVTYAFDTPYTALDGSVDINISISNINGGMDDDATNNMASTSITGYTPAENRTVFVEEGTGTWCPWCPRGDVFMKYMFEEYPEYFVGIAVHQGDPMEVPGYPAATAFTGYPTMKISREEVFGFGVVEDIESRFFPKVITPAPAVLGATATYDETTSEVVITASAEFMMDLEGHTFAVVVVEDGVTGTGAAYNQANNYAGGNLGQMGGYELLPSSVPASQMVYDHVGRAVLGGVVGEPGSLPSSVSMGETHTYDFPISFNPTWNVNKMELAIILMTPDATVANSKLISFDVARGISNSTQKVFTNDVAKVSPNPFSTFTNVELELETSSNVHMSIFSVGGQKVAEKSYGEMVGFNLLPIDGTQLNSGMYLVHIQLDDALITKKITLNK